jgi:hypothetical protein
MRDQYAGDLSDLLKFSLLLALALDDKSIGVGWYYNPTHDKLQDGRHREHCDEPKWKSLDRAVWYALRALPERSVKALENLPIWPMNTRFHRIPVPRAGSRASWASFMTAALQSAGIVFLDPDNGVGKASEQHATAAEVAAIRKPGRAVVLIKFPGRAEKHEEQINKYHTSLLTQTDALSAITVTTCVSVGVINKNGVLQGVPRVRWFTLIDADDVLIERAGHFASRLNEIEKCQASVVHGVTMSPEKPHDAVLRLMGVLERALRALTPDSSIPFYKQVEAHRGKFSDAVGITEARRIRNALAHGENVADARAWEAQAILEQALAEILPHCPERLRAAMPEATRSAPSVMASSAPRSAAATSPVSTQSYKPNQDRKADAALTICDWVYFATPSRENWDATRAVANEFRMIIRPVYNNSDPPNAIANVKHIRQGHTILLVYGGKGAPYRPMFACTVVAPPRPVPHFEAFSFADESQNERLEKSGYTPDPHLKRFTGISVAISAERFAGSGSVRKPTGNNTIWRWKHVEAYNAVTPNSTT